MAKTTVKAGFWKLANLGSGLELGSRIKPREKVASVSSGRCVWGFFGVTEKEEILGYAPSLNARFGVAPLAASVILISKRGRVDRQQLLTRLEKAWREFQQSYAGLSDAQMMKPGVVGEWSVRDILAHVTTWEQEALKHVPTLLKGHKPPRYSVTHGGIDGFNRIMTEQRRGLTLTEVRRDLENTHRRLVTYVDSVPEEQFRSETPFRRRLRLDTYRHYPKHAEAIRKWRNNGKKSHEPGPRKTDFN